MMEETVGRRLVILEFLKLLACCRQKIVCVLRRILTPVSPLHELRAMSFELLQYKLLQYKYKLFFV